MHVIKDIKYPKVLADRINTPFLYHFSPLSEDFCNNRSTKKYPNRINLRRLMASKRIQIEIIFVFLSDRIYEKTVQKGLG